MIVELKIPPGVSNNGTEWQNKGRWTDADNMRWYEGVMTPLGGYHTFAASVTSHTTPVRKALAWRDNSGNRFIAVGSTTKLEVRGDQMAYPNDVVDITPAGFTTGNEDGSGDTPADTWQMDTWGQYLVATCTSDGKLYEWQLDYGTPTAAAVISNAPTNNRGLIVTNERFLFALGAGGDPRKVQWCDQGNNAIWSPTTQNQAGSFVLETDGRIMCAAKGRGEILIFTDAGDVFSCRYIGRPLVYGFQKVASGAAPVGPNAVVAVDDGVFWMGRGAFYAYDGRVYQLPCAVRESIFQTTTRLDDEQRAKVCATTMRKYSEVWWIYPTDATETAYRYVTFSHREGHWSIGTAGGNVFVDRGAYEYPVEITPTGSVRYLDADNQLAGTDWWALPYAESGPIPLTTDRRWVHLRWLYWDHETAPQLASFAIQNWDDPVAGGNAVSTTTTFLNNLPVPLRGRARHVAIRVRAASNSLRFGAPQLDVVPGGRR